MKMYNSLLICICFLTATCLNAKGLSPGFLEFINKNFSSKNFEKIYDTQDKKTDKEYVTSNECSILRGLLKNPQNENVSKSVVEENTVIYSSSRVLLTTNTLDTLPSVSSFWKPLSSPKFKERRAAHSTPLALSPKVAVNCNGTIMAVPANRFLVKENDEGLLLKSSDNGANWKDMTAEIPYLSLGFKNNPIFQRARTIGIQDIFAAKQDFFLMIRIGSAMGLMQSKDEGKSWKLLSMDFTTMNSHLLEVLPSGVVNQIYDTSPNNTYSKRALKDQAVSAWDSLSNSWFVVEDCKLINSTRFSSLTYIFRRLEEKKGLVEYKQIRNYPNPSAYDLNPDEEYYYEKSLDGGHTWRKIGLPKSNEFWIDPWKEDKRVLTYYDETIWKQEAASDEWVPLFKMSKEEYYYGFKDFIKEVGVNGYGYVFRDGMLYKSTTPVFTQNACQQ